MIQPRNNRVLVKPNDAEAQSQGGILIPETAQEKATRGTVLAIGPGVLDPKSREFIPVTGIAVGDTVIFSKYASNEIKEAGEILYLMDEDSVFATVHTGA